MVLWRSLAWFLFVSAAFECRVQASMLAPVDHALEPAISQSNDDMTQDRSREVSECKDIGLETSEAYEYEASPPPLKTEFIQLTNEWNGSHPLPPKTPAVTESIPPPFPPPEWKTECGLG